MRFTREEMNFIQDVIGISVNEEETNEEILQRIWEEACEIEIEESNHLDELTDKGKMAVNLVTKLGED